MSRSAKILVGSVCIGVCLLVFGAISVDIYDSAEAHGWISHKRTTSVWISHEWPVGEFKKCALDVTEGAPVLNCDNTAAGAYHDISVDFHGSLVFPEMGEQSNWNCQRKQNAVFCKAAALTR